jgi:hypothetical protein
MEKREREREIKKFKAEIKKDKIKYTSKYYAYCRHLVLGI